MIWVIGFALLFLHVFLQGYPMGLGSLSEFCGSHANRSMWWTISHGPLTPGFCEYHDLIPTGGLQTNAVYADIGISVIMPNTGLCRLLLIVFPIYLLFQHIFFLFPLYNRHN
jgi:hypothetical protein